MVDVKSNNNWRLWRWSLYLLIGLAIPTSYIVWNTQAIRGNLFGLQPPAIAFAQPASGDVIGDLGGIKVRIPKYYAEYVERDNDSGYGEKHSQHSISYRLRSFGMNVRFPDMKGMETPQLKEDYQGYRLKPENPWVSISVNAGEIYPSMGVNANDGLAKKLWEKSEYWFANYERAPEMDVAGLEAYVVAGTDPRTGKLARESDSVEDVYIHKIMQNHVATYISCGKTSISDGIAHCQMYFGLEPKAKARIKVTFYPALLPKWRSIQDSISELIYGFEVKNPEKE